MVLANNRGRRAHYQTCVRLPDSTLAACLCKLPV